MCDIYKLSQGYIQYPTKFKAFLPHNQNQKFNFKGVMTIEQSDVFVPTNDYVFKRIFGRVGNEVITKGDC